MVRVYFYLSKKGDKVFSTPRTPYQLSRNYYKSYQGFFKWHHPNPTKLYVGKKLQIKRSFKETHWDQPWQQTVAAAKGLLGTQKKLHLMAQTDTQTHRQADMATL